MTEQEMMIDILSRFSSCSCSPITLPNGHLYVEACLSGGWVSAEFDENGNVVEFEAGD